eukprot:scpid4915/ scgid3682/ Acyl-coenzyme A oxidase 3, peroxisomal; Medium-chain acyl-CoA oxidase
MDEKPVTSMDLGGGMPGVVAELQQFIERHNQDERQRVFKLLLQPPFSPLQPDLHMHVQRDNAWRRMERVAELGMMDLMRVPWPSKEQNMNLWAWLESLSMHDMSLATMLGAQLGLCVGAIITMGTDEQREELIPGLVSCKHRGCFAMTELGHGSNVRDLETMATFDPSTKEFVIHTPSNSAQKFWIGGGVDAHIAVVMAQLYTQGQSCGVHGFTVRLRDDTGQLRPGVRVADVGHKIGLNGVSNARFWFDKVRVPLGSLLSRYGGVDADGAYSSFIEDRNLRFAMCLAELLRGRIAIICAAVSISKVTVGTAIRYGLSRRQFRVGNGEEILLMDYPMHQRRLLPYLAMAYALQCASHRVQAQWNERSEDITERMQQMKTIHILTSGYKAVGGWFARDAIQSSREACGGLGYASWNHIGRLKADFDASLTYEGDNCVLLALTTRQLMKMYRKGVAKRGFPADSMMSHQNSMLQDQLDLQSLRYPVMWQASDGDTDAGRVVNAGNLFDVPLRRHPVFLLNCLEVREKLYMDLLSKQLQVEQDKVKHVPASEVDDRIWNACGSLAVDCGKAFFERQILQWFIEDIGTVKSKTAHTLLSKLASLYGLWLVLADARFCGTSSLSVGIQDEMRQEFDALLAEVRVHCRCLVDGLCVPDSFLGPIALVRDSNDEFWSYEQTLKNSTFAGRAKL